jgi:Tol biopolymer transport system component
VFVAVIPWGGGSDNVYSFNVENRSLKKLTNLSPDANAFHPTFSPDGEKIAFILCVDADEYCGLWIMDRSGINKKMLSDSARIISPPLFSQEGGKIAFVCGKNFWNICIANTTTGETTQLTSIENRSDRVEYLSWSPDGKYVAFRWRSNSVKIWKVNTDNGTLSLLIPEEIEAETGVGEWCPTPPVWNPDGSLVVYEGYRGNVILLVISSEGGIGKKRVMSDNFQCSHASWSPDGNKIAYEWHGELIGAVRLMDKDGTNDTFIDLGLCPQISPDGKKIAYLCGGTRATQRGEICLAYETSQQATPAFTFAITAGVLILITYLRRNRRR